MGGYDSRRSSLRVMCCIVRFRGEDVPPLTAFPNSRFGKSSVSKRDDAKLRAFSDSANPFVSVRALGPTSAKGEVVEYVINRLVQTRRGNAKGQAGIADAERS